jgi:uncharacterized protein (TIGR02246 family)
VCGPALVPPRAGGSGETHRIFASAVALVATTLIRGNSMKYSIAFAALFVMAACSPANDGSATSTEMLTDTEIVEALDAGMAEFTAAWAAGDPERLSDLYVEDAVRILNDVSGPIRGKDAIRAEWVARFASEEERSSEATINNVRLSYKVIGPDLVIVDGIYELFDEEGNFGYRGFWSTVERIRDGISRIVLETAGEYKVE